MINQFNARGEYPNYFSIRFTHKLIRLLIRNV